MNMNMNGKVLELYIGTNAKVKNAQNQMCGEALNYK